MKTTEALFNCDKCGRKNFTAIGLRTHRCKPKKIDSSLVVLPPEKKGNRTLSVRFDNTVKQIGGGRFANHQHNLFHRNGMLATAQAACWLVLAGVALLEEKKKVGHGNWEQWVEENCEFSDRTARRYIELAMGVKNKALKAGLKAPADLLDLLQTPAHLLSPEKQKHLLQAVHKLTDGATVQQLYLDFGITKKPQGGGVVGGYHPSADEGNMDPSTPEGMARLQILPTFQELTTKFFQTDKANIPQWSRLPREELQLIDTTLLDMRNAIKEALRAKS